MSMSSFRTAVIALLTAVPAMLCSAISFTAPAGLSINALEFELEPYVRIKTGQNLYQIVSFTSTGVESQGIYDIQYSSEILDLAVRILPTESFLKQCRRVEVEAHYKQNIQVKDIALNLIFNPANPVTFLKGPRAINSGNEADNQNLYPYTDKVIEYRNPAGSFWLAASGYAGCSGVEMLLGNSVRLYDHTLHMARLYTPPNSPDRLIDQMPRSIGQSDSWSFLIFEEKPYLVSINRWMGDKKAALAITHDADAETLSRLQAVYFGSSNPDSPSYMTKGLIANHIPVSNTVFGIDINSLGSVWDAIQDAGNSIGYHTYSSFSDSTNDTAQSLLTEMSDYNVRLWIDHAHNNENFAEMGTWPDSAYYSIDVINQSQIDYAWMYDVPSTNPFNAFDDPWRLPHKLPHLQNLTRPVWFFGRTRMETWEFLNEAYMLDFKHVMTAENLDKLLQDKGLCIGYTHFCFANVFSKNGFHIEMPNGDYEIRDEFNDVLVMLNEYQNNRGLWIDTVESIFDRMLAIEQVEIKSVNEVLVPGFVEVTLENKSDTDLPNLTFFYGAYKHETELLAANSQITVLLNKNKPPSTETSVLPFNVQYKSGNIYIRSKDSQTIPPMQVSFYNIKGQLVGTAGTAVPSNYLTIPFNPRASGLYFSRIKAEGYKAQTTRFSVIK
jgi:hypothetical protein